MIFLEEKERNYLRQLLEKSAEKEFWIGKKILEKIDDDIKRIEEMNACDHVEAEYVGKKTCCGKCEANFKEGHGFEWRKK